MKMLLLVGVLLSAVSINAMADEQRFTVASFDITPCSKMVTYRDSLGLTWPTLTFAPQRTSLVVSVGHTPDLSQEAFNSANGECNGLALVAATGIAFALDPAAFASTYEGAYSACMEARLAGSITGIGVNVETSCRW